MPPDPPAAEALSIPAAFLHLQSRYLPEEFRVQPLVKVDGNVGKKLIDFVPIQGEVSLLKYKGTSAVHQVSCDHHQSSWSGLDPQDEKLWKKEAQCLPSSRNMRLRVQKSLTKWISGPHVFRSPTARSSCTTVVLFQTTAWLRA